MPQATLLGDINDRQVGGSYLEAGVWRGGSSIFATAAMQIFGMGDRPVYLCDSFRGLPRPENILSLGDFSGLRAAPTLLPPHRAGLGETSCPPTEQAWRVGAALSTSEEPKSVDMIRMAVSWLSATGGSVAVTRLWI